MISDPLYRFVSNVRVQENGCWLWAGGKHRKGYGKFWWNNHTGFAHQFAYLHWRGVIPEGMEPDHLCRTPACVNPYHLEAVTRRENLIRGNSPVGLNFRKTHCIRGHLLAGDNLYAVLRNGREHRHCRACLRDRARNAYRANPEKFRERKRKAYAPSRIVGEN